jgi:hypothetical protein
MNSIVKRSLSFAAAVAMGALAFGAFWSTQVHARSSGGTAGPYCTDSTSNATMCLNGTTITNVPPATQSAYLSNHQATCGACPTSGS